MNSKLNLGHNGAIKEVIAQQLNQARKALTDSPLEAITPDEAKELLSPASRYLGETPEGKAAIENRMQEIFTTVWKRDDEIGDQEAKEGIISYKQAA